MKTPIEAFEYTLDIIKNIGIKTNVQTNLNCKQDDELIEKYTSKADSVPFQNWCRITFYPKNQNENELIYRKQLELLDLGISFDSGGGCGGRDWELDWSFSFNPNRNTTNKRHRIEIVNKLQNELGI